MGVVIESSIWEPNPSLYLFLFFCCCLSIFLFAYASNCNRTSTLFDHGVYSSFLRFPRSFLLLYSLASVMEGLWSVYGEFELASNRISREQMVISLGYGYAAALFAGPFFGMLSDLIHKKACLIFVLCTSSLAYGRGFQSVQIFSLQQGRKLDSVNDTFWLMNFFESACLIVSQIFSKWLIGNHAERNIVLPSTTAIFLAIICIAFIT